MDDDTYAAQVDTLLDLLKQVNRFAGRQGQTSAQGVDPAAGKIAELAVALGHAAEPGQIASAGTGDPAGTISALTMLLSRRHRRPNFLFGTAALDAPLRDLTVCKL